MTTFTKGTTLKANHRVTVLLYEANRRKIIIFTN